MRIYIHNNFLLDKPAAIEYSECLKVFVGVVPKAILVRVKAVRGLTLHRGDGLRDQSKSASDDRKS